MSLENKRITLTVAAVITLMTFVFLLGGQHALYTYKITVLEEQNSALMRRLDNLDSRLNQVGIRLTRIEDKLGASPQR